MVGMPCEHRQRLNTREVVEFVDKIKRAGASAPDFELDLSKMVDGSVFEDRFAEAMKRG